MLTINRVNKQIAAQGLKMELVKGRDYFYFFGKDVKHDAVGVYVYRLNELSLNQWLDEALERRNNA